jgi:hypothetical protein
MMTRILRLLAAALLLCLTGESLSSPQDAAAPGRKTDRSRLWNRDGRNILHGFQNLYNFHVIEEPGQVYRFKAWFFGWAVEDCNRNVKENTGCDAIFHARARSLEGPWEVYAGGDRWDTTMTPALWQPVITAQQTFYDAWHNGDPSVVKVKDRYYMAYSSTGNNRDGKPYGDPADTDGSLLCIMGAVSKDGIRWERSKAPILMHAADVGAKTVPEGDSHLYGSYHRPSLLYENGRFRLWFDYWTEKGVTMGYAENRGDFLDAGQWKVIRAGKEPCLEEFPNPEVVRVGDLLYAYADPSGYGSHPWTSRKIGEAVSKDGLNWVFLGYIETDPDAPAIHVPEALVRKEGRDYRLFLFYACQIGGEPYDYRYNRIRVMHRVLTRETLRRDRQLCAP